ncbi:MAG: Plug domain-containing protein, partial [Hyphomonadaceae bacterium]
MKTWTRLLLCGASIATLLAAAPAFAQAPAGPAEDQQPASQDGSAKGDTPKQDTVIIYGRATEQIGEAQSASEGVVGYADFETRPLTRPGELVEVIPGMVAAQHSGGGKANQYFLRGFNLDHGTDFSLSVDGLPV